MVQYNPLDPQKSEIRLVTLLPGKPRDAIRCTLSTASLDSPPEFTALSYVWGNPSETKPIILDGEPFDVTVNLEAGLRAMRKQSERCVLWIDAICINQKDVQEKNVQVPQMGRLYSTAPAVLVWLGPSNSNIELFVSWMRAHATTSPDDAASTYWSTLDTRSADSESARRERDWAVAGAHEGYYDFLALPYWSRVWTFQEYLLPRNSPEFLCGNLQPFQLSSVLGELELETLKELDYQAMERLGTEDRTMYGKGLAEFVKVRERRVTKIASTLSIASSVSSLPHLRPTGSLDQRLADMLYFTSDRQCFDERDKIFGLYGIVPAAQDVYPPDYTKPITEAMLQAAAYIVNFEHMCDVLLRFFGLRGDRLSDSRLYPSWMPDFFSNGNSSSIHTLAGGMAIPLTRSEDVPAPASVEQTTLRFWARRLGTCKVAVRFADTQEDILEQINGLLQMNMLEDNMGKTVRKPETLISRIARACVAQQWSLSYKFSTKEILETFYLAFNSGPDAVESDSSYESCWYSIQSATENLKGKALLVTEDGCFGIGVGGARDGDIVVIPPEVKVPLILTRESTTSADGVQYYKMVGTAIIDGVMGEGDLLDEELVEEIAKRDVAEFLVH